MLFSRDPLINSVYQGIKLGINVTYENECFGSCLVLIYCGIDAMSYLDMPASQIEAHADDFIRWAGQYLSPNLKNTSTQITGEDLYSARCAIVHTYTVESRKTKSGTIRMIGYMIDGVLPIASDTKVNPNLVLLRLDTLRDAFFTGIDRFLMASYSDKQKRPLLDERLRTLLNTIPYSK